jgi:O-acetyl-ADP-ribose deacetylase (regulator of RNase III)
VRLVTGFLVIGSSIAGSPIYSRALLMLTEVRDHLHGTASLERVEFVLHDQLGVAAFNRARAHLKD